VSRGWVWRELRESGERMLTGMGLLWGRGDENVLKLTMVMMCNFVNILKPFKKKVEPKSPLLDCGLFIVICCFFFFEGRERRFIAQLRKCVKRKRKHSAHHQPSLGYRLEL
jgi:hypothetical protein